MRINVAGRTYAPSEFLRTASAVLYHEIIRPIAGFPSRLVFGNFVGVKNNVGPLVAAGVSKLRNKGAYSTLGAAPQEKARILNRTGFVLLKTIDVDSIVRSYRKHIESPGSALTGLGGKIRYVYNPIAKIPELKSFVTAEIDAIARAYFHGSSYKIGSVRAWRNYHVPTNRPERDVGISNAFHEDGARRTDLRLFVLLSDGVTRYTGATRFHDKATSARLARDPRFFSRRWQSSGIKRELIGAPSYFEGNAGDACLMNAQECLHAASIPGAGAWRDIVAFELVPCRHHVALNDVFNGMPQDGQINSKVMTFLK